jgi:peptidoglycan-N-acetylglucosamine deacetylase
VIKRRHAVSALGATALLALAHAAPSVTGISPLRRLVFPRLHGLGRPDHVALTFDDGPDPASTPHFLRELDALGWKATFFMLGSMASTFPEVASEVAAAGHEIALHGEIHRSHLLRLPGDVRHDVHRGYDHVSAASGVAPRFFRPPYGALSSTSLMAGRDLGLDTVLWTSWGRDWRANATPASVLADVHTDLEPGATVLLHDSDCTSAPECWRSALGALPLLAETFASRGWSVGPLRDHSLVVDGGRRRR